MEMQTGRPFLPILTQGCAALALGYIVAPRWGARAR